MKKLMMLVAMTVIVATLPLTAASAHGETPRVYLSLGDSIAAGTQNPEPFTDDGYTDVLYKKIRWDMGLTEHVNLACPGDDTSEFINGDNGPNGGSHCYGDGAPIPFGADSQLDAALAYLTANEGDVALITITIGANDLLACDPPTQECVGAALTTAATNLQATILPALRSAAPDVPIVAMNYYNPNLAYWLTPGGDVIAAQTNALAATSNDVLAASYAAYGVPVVDVAAAFHIYDEGHSTVPKNVRKTCQLTLMCERTDGHWQIAANPDIHPNDRGYRRIARAFKRTLVAEGIIN